MHSIYNGMTAAELGEARWQKSSFSGTSNCIEMAQLQTGEVAVRNSRDLNGPTLVYTRGEIETLLHGIRNGDFDALVR
jgi:hypothetical protein